MTDIERARHAIAVETEYLNRWEKNDSPPKREWSGRGTPGWWNPLDAGDQTWRWDKFDYRLVPDPPPSVEVGQWYETRGKRSALIVTRHGECGVFGFIVDGARKSTCYWTDSGTFSAGGANDLDLIRRIDPPEFAKEWARKWLGGGVEVPVKNLWVSAPEYLELTPELREWMTKHGATFKE